MVLLALSLVSLVLRFSGKPAATNWPTKDKQTKKSRLRHFFETEIFLC